MSRHPMKRLFGLGVAVITLSVGAAAGAAPRPVVLELFTSSGCSSCPPAEQLLSQLRNEPPVDGVKLILLSQHVDYWNNLGWVDRYSDARFTARQRRYAQKVFGSSRVYTPQLVVNGRREMVGSRRNEVVSAIRGQADTLRVPVAVKIARRSGNTLAVNIDVGNGESAAGARVWVALTEDDVVTHVGAGENSGRTLNENGVVRQLVAANDSVGRSRYGARVDLPADAQKSHLSVVAFVQRQPMGDIVGAARQPLAGVGQATSSESRSATLARATR